MEIIVSFPLKLILHHSLHCWHYAMPSASPSLTSLCRDRRSSSRSQPPVTMHPLLQPGWELPAPCEVTLPPPPVFHQRAHLLQQGTKHSWVGSCRCSRQSSSVGGKQGAQPENGATPSLTGKGHHCHRSCSWGLSHAEAVTSASLLHQPVPFRESGNQTP